jgi:hypothetical protein
MQFPKALEARVLSLIHHSTFRLEDLVNRLYDLLRAQTEEGGGGDGKSVTRTSPMQQQEAAIADEGPGGREGSAGAEAEAGAGGAGGAAAALPAKKPKAPKAPVSKPMLRTFILVVRAGGVGWGGAMSSVLRGWETIAGCMHTYEGTIP